MNKPCSVSNCRSPVRARYSGLCSGHRKALGRHGHPLQTAIAAPEVAPFLKLVAKRQAENPDSRAWTILRNRYSVIVDSANATAEAVNSGAAYIRIEAEAARLIRGVAAVADADLVIRTCMAVTMHSRANPRRYVCDKAVPYAMARRFLRLAPSSVGRYWCNVTKKSRTVHRDIPPRVLELIAGRLNEAFGGAGAQLYSIELARVPPEEVERRHLASALEGLRA